MPDIPPMVAADVIDNAPAYLLGWERMPAAEGGGWGARIAWVEIREGGAWVVRGGVVPASRVKRLPGQDYSKVPRDSRPTDPSDPRDRHRKEKPQDRAYFEELARRAPADDEHEEHMRRLDGDF